MRKFLWVVAVGALVLAVAAPAMALDFKFGSEYRLRFYSADNVTFGATGGGVPGANPRGAQLRVRPRFDTSDDNGNITATLRLEIGDIEFGNGGGAQGVTNGVNITPGSARVGNGAGGSLGNDGVNVETKWAYIDFAAPFGAPFRVRAGLQPWFTPKGILVDDDTIGIRAYGERKPVSYELAWYRASGGPSTAAALGTGQAGQSTTSNTFDNNYDFYQFRTDVALAPWFNPGLYYIFGRNATNCTPTPCPPTNRVRESHYIGFTTTGKAGIVSYDLDWIYATTDGGPAGTFGTKGGVGPHTVAGWALDSGVHFPVGPVTVNLVGAYGSGDSQKGDNKSGAFPAISPSWNGAGGLYEMIGSGGPFDAVEFGQDAPTNLWMLGVVFEYRPVKPLYTKLAWGYQGFAKKNGNCTPANIPAGSVCYGPAYAGRPDKPLAGKSGLGNEISLFAAYDLYTGFKVQGELGWLIPTQGDTASEYVLQLLYSF